MTRQRALVLKTIRESTEHLSAMELYERVRAVMPDIALATIYNNLNALEEAGEIRRLHMQTGTDRYDKSSKPHAHFVCDRCGNVTDVFLDGLDKFFSQQINADINSYELNIHGHCGCEQK